MADGVSVTMRPIEAADMHRVHELNQAAVPHVSKASFDRMQHLVDISEYSMIPEVEGLVAGYVLGMGPGNGYDSQNYAWFSNRYDRFIYIDRIVVAEEFRGRGIGRAIYTDVERYTRPLAPVILCEVNTRPMNEESLKFHAALGFVEVGRQDTEGGTKSVALLEKRVG